MGGGVPPRTSVQYENLKKHCGLGWGSKVHSLTPALSAWGLQRCPVKLGTTQCWGYSPGCIQDKFLISQYCLSSFHTCKNSSWRLTQIQQYLALKKDFTLEDKFMLQQMRFQGANYIQPWFLNDSLLLPAFDIRKHLLVQDLVPPIVYNTSLPPPTRHSQTHSTHPLYTHPPPTSAHARASDFTVPATARSCCPVFHAGSGSSLDFIWAFWASSLSRSTIPGAYRACLSYH